MNTPNVDVTTLPGLESSQGLFGSISHSATAYNDGVVAIMVYVYDVLPPETVV